MPGLVGDKSCKVVRESLWGQKWWNYECRGLLWSRLGCLLWTIKAFCSETSGLLVLFGVVGIRHLRNLASLLIIYYLWLAVTQD